MPDSYCCRIVDLANMRAVVNTCRRLRNTGSGQISAADREGLHKQIESLRSVALRVVNSVIEDAKCLRDRLDIWPERFHPAALLVAALKFEMSGVAQYTAPDALNSTARALEKESAAILIAQPPRADMLPLYCALHRTLRACRTIKKLMARATALLQA